MHGTDGRTGGCWEPGGGGGSGVRVGVFSFQPYGVSVGLSRIPYPLGGGIAEGRFASHSMLIVESGEGGKGEVFLFVFVFYVFLVFSHSLPRGTRWGTGQERFLSGVSVFGEGGAWCGWVEELGLVRAWVCSALRLGTCSGVGIGVGSQVFGRMRIYGRGFSSRIA